MFRSYHLFSLFGVPVFAHGSLALLVVAALVYAREPGLESFLTMCLFLLLVVVSMLLHEIGHAIVAIRHRLPVRRITIYPFVATAAIDAARLSPPLELRVALAGPLVNLILAGLVTPLHIFHPSWFVTGLLYVNLILGVFNLLPGFPMDGGRVLRAWLARKRDYLTATRIAIRVGQWMAVALGIVGIGLGEIFLCLLAIFLFIKARMELAVALMGMPLASIQEFFSRMARHEAPPGPPPSDPVNEIDPEAREEDREDDCIVEIDPDGKVRKIQRGQNGDPS